jgi:sugar/nucleoside kinase (ribokinase family)
VPPPGEAAGPGHGRHGGVLAVVGDLTEDVVVWLEEPLRPGTDTVATVHRSRGGSAANVAAFAARLGPTRFLGCVGDDPTGDQVVARLEGDGVDVRVQKRGVTATVVVVVDETGERTMFPSRGASALLADPHPAWLDGVAHLHAPAYALDTDPARTTVLTLLRAVKEQGGTTSVDASATGLLERLGVPEVRELLHDLAPDWLFANEEEAELLAPDGAVEWLSATTALVVKRGPRSTLVRRRGQQPVEVPVAPVAVVRDTTGCGDAFAAAFLTEVLRGATDEEACLAGHALAATLLATPGASV